MNFAYKKCVGTDRCGDGERFRKLLNQGRFCGFKRQNAFNPFPQGAGKGKRGLPCKA